MNGVVKKISLAGFTPQPKTGLNQSQGYNNPPNLNGEMMNFSNNELLTVDRIVKACFANPDRRRYPSMKFGDMSMPLVGQDYTAEYWINRARNEMPG